MMGCTCSSSAGNVIFIGTRSFAVNIKVLLMTVPIPVAVRSKAWVCGRSLTGIVGSNPA
jgi:hypothetical protein